MVKLADLGQHRTTHGRLIFQWSQRICATLSQQVDHRGRCAAVLVGVTGPEKSDERLTDGGTGRGGCPCALRFLRGPMRLRHGQQCAGHQAHHGHQQRTGQRRIAPGEQPAAPQCTDAARADRQVRQQAPQIVGKRAGAGVA